MTDHPIAGVTHSLRRESRSQPVPPPPMLRNGGWRGLRLTIRNSTSTPLAQPLTRLPHPSIPPHRTPSRFAPSNTPCQFGRPRRSQRARPSQPRPVTLAASARATSNAPSLRDHSSAAASSSGCVLLTGTNRPYHAFFITVLAPETRPELSRTEKPLRCLIGKTFRT